MQEDVYAALEALEIFAGELAKFGVPQRLQRPIVRLAWKTVRTGLSVEESGTGARGDHALLAAEEAALAEIGAILVAAAIEAEAAKLRRPSPAAGGKGKVGQGVQWKRLTWRVEACSRAAAAAGALPERCSALQQFGLVLLDRYRRDLGGPPAGSPKGSGKAGKAVLGNRGEAASATAAAADDAARLWVLPREGAAWHGPITAREVLRLAEAGQLGFDALIFGLDEKQAGQAPERETSKPLGQSFPALGNLARKDSKAAARRRDEEG